MPSHHPQDNHNYNGISTWASRTASAATSTRSTPEQDSMPGKQKKADAGTLPASGADPSRLAQRKKRNPLPASEATPNSGGGACGGNQARPKKKSKYDFRTGCAQMIVPGLADTHFSARLHGRVPIRDQ